MVLGMCEVSSDKDFVIVVIVIDNADIFRHAISRHHAAGSFRRLLNIAGCACRNVIKNDFFSDSAAEGNHDVLFHFSFCQEHFVFFRKRHCISCSADSCGYDRHRINRTNIRKHMKEYRMPRLMIGRNFFLFFGNYAALLFRTDSHLDKRFLNIFLLHENPFVHRRVDCRLVQKIL